MQNKDIKCPNCSNKISFGLDEWGYTPFHLHCEKCSINIGAQSINQCIDIFKQYHSPHTYIEFYHNEIKLMIENRKFIIDKEKKL